MLTMDRIQDQILSQVDFKKAPLIFLSFAGLLLLACYLYGIKPDINKYHDKHQQLIENPEIDSLQRDIDLTIQQRETHIAKLEEELAAYDQVGDDTAMIPFTMDALNALAMKHDVTILSITPSEPITSGDYETVKFRLKLRGDYQQLYNWLVESERQLPSHLFPYLQLRPLSEGDRCELDILLVSHRMQG